MLEMVSLVGIWQVSRMGTNTEESLIQKKEKQQWNVSWDEPVLHLQASRASTSVLLIICSADSNFSKVTLTNISDNLDSAIEVAENSWRYVIFGQWLN